MMTVTQVREWLDTLEATDHVAIDDGGLALVALDDHAVELDAWCEVGGIPQDEDEGE
jgi:hypothetical protein